MSLFIYVLVLVLAVVLLECVEGLIKLTNRNIPLWVGFVGVGMLALSPLYYEYPSPTTSVPVTFENGQVHSHPWGMFCWEWSHDWGNMPLADGIVSSDHNWGAKTDFVTKSDQRRKCGAYLSLVLAIDNPNEWYRYQSRQGLGSGLAITVYNNHTAGQLKEISCFLLNQFVEGHRLELEKIIVCPSYNPLVERVEKPEDQFRSMIEKSLAPILTREGLKVVEAKCDLYWTKDECECH